MEKENLDKQKANGIKPDVTKPLFLAGCLSYLKNNLKHIDWKNVARLLIGIEIILPIIFRICLGNWDCLYVSSAFSVLIIIVVIWLILFGKE